MKVRRVVSNILAADPQAAVAFYRDLLGLDVLMDMGWIVTLGNGEKPRVQMSIASEGGSGTPLPALSIEVDDLDEALQRMREAGIAIEYGPVEEPWGVRRFFVHDPVGTLVNILTHL
jgi:catechol 2,3-dioxygenase-like lactoylglutathione lyase family enzyme